MPLSLLVAPLSPLIKHHCPISEDGQKWAQQVADGEILRGSARMTRGFGNLGKGVMGAPAQGRAEGKSRCFGTVTKVL